jgi:hypothetical protein
MYWSPSHIEKFELIFILKLPLVNLDLTELRIDLNIQKSSFYGVNVGDGHTHIRTKFL